MLKFKKLISLGIVGIIATVISGCVSETKPTPVIAATPVVATTPVIATTPAVVTY